MQSRFAFGTRLHRVSKIIVIFDQGAFLVPNANAFVCFHMKAFLFYHTQFCLSRTFLTFFEVFQPRIQFLKPFQNFSSRFAVLLNSLFSISQEEPLVNNFFFICEKIFFRDRCPSRDSLISIRQFPPLVNRFFDFFLKFFLKFSFSQMPLKQRPFPFMQAAHLTA